MNIDTSYLKDKYEALLEKNPDSILQTWRRQGFSDFNKWGVPTLKHEEWKYTGVGRLFKKNYDLSPAESISDSVLDKSIIPGLEKANEIVFVNGIYDASKSVITDKDDLVVMTLEDASNSEYQDLVKENFGKSKESIDDGIMALNTSLMDDGIFILVKKNKELSQPVYFNYIFDATENHILANPRSLIIVEENARMQLIKSYYTEGAMDSFCNEVTEIVAMEDSIVDYYKIQNDSPNASQTGTTHIRQVGKCLVYTVVISLDGGMIRNNTNVVMEAEHNEAHLYGLFLLKGKTHVDNHSIVDNMVPHALSNELYKGILDDSSTGVFNGKIFVRRDAQKIDAYQTNNNIVLSENATINTKPQLEIWADDVKCSHGCTIGQLDKDQLYYCRARGINEDLAKSILLQAFAKDIVDKIKNEPVREYVNNLISERLKIEEF